MDWHSIMGAPEEETVKEEKQCIKNNGLKIFTILMKEVNLQIQEVCQ